MPYLLGENVNIGVGTEDVRGTGVLPQVFIPGRTPTGVRPILNKVLIKETRKTRVASQDSEITQIRAEGDLEFNLRANSIGFLLKSLLGAVDSAPVVGEANTYQHDFSLDTSDPQNPTLTLALSQEGQQHYEYPNAVVKSIEIKTPVNDLVNAKVAFIATKETEHANYTTEFTEADYYFRHYNVTIKIADTVSELASSNAIAVKEFSISIDNNARVDQNISDLNPSDVLGMLLEVKGSLLLDYVGKENHDTFVAGEYKAMSITLERTDLTIGSTKHPKLSITLPKISFENLTPDRPIDDVVRDKIDFVAHFDQDEQEAIEATLINTQANYDTAESGS